MADKPKDVPSVTGPDDPELEVIYNGLPDHVRRLFTLDEFRRTAETPQGPYVPFEDVVAEIERVHEENQRKRNAG
jgi:hypothetical protein